MQTCGRDHALIAYFAEKQDIKRKKKARMCRDPRRLSSLHLVSALIHLAFLVGKRCVATLVGSLSSSSAKDSPALTCSCVLSSFHPTLKLHSSTMVALVSTQWVMGWKSWIPFPHSWWCAPARSLPSTLDRKRTVFTPHFCKGFLSRIHPSRPRSPLPFLSARTRPFSNPDLLRVQKGMPPFSPLIIRGCASSIRSSRLVERDGARARDQQRRRRKCASCEEEEVLTAGHVEQGACRKQRNTRSEGKGEPIGDEPEKKRGPNVLESDEGIERHARFGISVGPWDT